MEIDDCQHGFRLIRREPIAEIDADAWVFAHEATGAPLVWLANDDDNKVFLISFRTPVDNDTGVPHILEHSVLNGSRKYPLKEPFAELLKGSLYTFLNAFTYPDKTVYPVASRNELDFRNLMDVYLDAVFHPHLSVHTFLQEGWHYTVDPDGTLGYSGVVFNEMQGAYSDPETLLGDELDRRLFPDTAYGNSSGGHPAHITDLTHEQFVAFHRRFYHPSNSRIVLYGDLDIASTLAHLQSYLGDYTAQPADSAVQSQPRFAAPVSHTARYPITPGDRTERQTYALRAWLLGPTTDAEDYLAMSILAHILCGTQASPLRQALIDSHLGEDCLADGVDQDIYDTYFSIGLKGTDPDRVSAMEQVIDETLQRLVRDGIDPRMVEASINTTEFNLREANFGGYPKGLIYGLQMHASWLYDADPLIHLRYEETLAAIKRQVAEGRYFERLIEERFLKNPHRVTLSLVPDDELEARSLAEQRERLAAHRATLSAADVEAISRQQRELQEAQLRPDPPEALATIPKLPLSAIDRQAEAFPFELLQENPFRFSFSEQPTHGIGYLKVSFDALAVPDDLIPALSLFSRVLLQVGTEKRSYIDLTQEIGIQTGGISCGHAAASPLARPDELRSSLSFSAKALTAKLPELIGLLAEIVTQANLRHVPRLKEIAHMARARLQAAIVPGGHAYVSQRLAAYDTPSGKVAELTGGIAQYHYLDHLIGQLDDDPEPVVASLEALRELVLTRPVMHVHLTGGREELAALQACLPALAEALPDRAAPIAALDLPAFAPGEGFIVPSKIQYVGKGFNLYRHGFTYDGSFELLKKYLSRDYLWNKVRVQGNAYGCFATFDILSGALQCVSYRDPNLRETLAVFDAFADHLAAHVMPREEFEKLMIGTFGSIDAPKTPEQKGATAFARYRSGIAQAQIQAWRDQLLACQPEDLAMYVELFRRFRDQAHLCVIGGEEKLNAERTAFRSLTKVFGNQTTGALLPNEEEDEE